MLKRFADAEPKFRAVLDAKPDSVQAARGLAETSGRREESLRPRRRGENIWQLQPNDPAVRGRIVHTLVEQQNYDEAHRRTGSRRSRQSSDCGFSAAARGHSDRAEENGRRDRHAEASPGAQSARSAVAHRARASFTWRSGTLFPPRKRFRQRCSSIRRVSWCGRISARPTTWQEIARPRWERWTSSRSRRPPNAASWFIRALCYDTLHQVKPALEAYQKFLALDEGKNPDQVWQAQERSKVLKHHAGREAAIAMPAMRSGVLVVLAAAESLWTCRRSGRR